VTEEKIKYKTCPDCKGHGKHIFMKVIRFTDGTDHQQRDTIWCDLCCSTGLIEESDYLIMKLSGKF